jgi:RNA polymerase sigma-70 factor, ECF subfamily
MVATTGRRSEGVALIGRMAEGDVQAFADFYDRYAPVAFALVRRIVIQAADAEDVLQEIFWQAWLEATSYDETRGSPEAWLLNRARSRAIDRVRSIRRRSEMFVGPPAENVAPPPGDAGENPARVAEDRARVQPALARLPEAQRRVIELAFYEGLTQSEIARRLGEPLGTIKTRTRTGMERLREHFRASERGSG